MSSAAALLRAQNSVAGSVGVMIYSNRFRPEKPQHFGWDIVALPVPSCDTFKLLDAALCLLGRIYRPGIGYKKAGVILTDLAASSSPQADLFCAGDDEHRLALMATLDRLHAKFGRSSIRLAAELVGHNWHVRKDRLSPCYTTRWEDVPLAA
jgi:DNA polymerase V